MNGKSVYDLVKIKNQSRKQSHKRNGVGVRRIRTFPFSSYSSYDSVEISRSSENQIVRVGERRFSSLNLPLLLATPTIKFSLERKRRSPKRNQNAVFTDLNFTSYASDYHFDSNSVASENQPLF